MCVRARVCVRVSETQLLDSVKCEPLTELISEDVSASVYSSAGGNTLTSSLRDQTPFRFTLSQ